MKIRIFADISTDNRLLKSHIDLLAALEQWNQSDLDTNHHDTLFGGTAVILMDEVAFITATRFSRQVMVTVIPVRKKAKRYNVSLF